MTQGNATDGRPGLRTSLLARLDELIAGCRSAEKAREAVAAFVEGRTGMRGLDPDIVSGVYVQHEDEQRALLLSDLRAILDVLPDPALYLGLRAEVERHREGTVAVPVFDQFDSPTQPGCIDCNSAVCGFVARWASLLGVGGGASGTGCSCGRARSATEDQDCPLHGAGAPLVHFFAAPVGPYACCGARYGTATADPAQSGGPCHCILPPGHDGEHACEHMTAAPPPAVPQAPERSEPGRENRD